MLRRIRLAVSGKRLALRIEEMEVIDVRRDGDSGADLGPAVAGRTRREHGSVITSYMDVARLAQVLHGFVRVGEDLGVTGAFPQLLGTGLQRY